MVYLTLLLGCSKKNQSTRLTGAWREMTTSGGLGAETTRFDKEMRLLQLNEDSTWAFRLNDTLKQSGVYSLSTVTYDGVTFNKQISFKDGASGYIHTQIVQWKDGQMSLMDNNIYEGYYSVYTRFSH
jgi:hypothetical protein